MIHQLWHAFFPPGGWSVGGNLLASVLYDTPLILGALWHHRRQIRKDLNRVRDRLDKIEKRKDGATAPP